MRVDFTFCGFSKAIRSCSLSAEEAHLTLWLVCGVPRIPTIEFPEEFLSVAMRDGFIMMRTRCWGTSLEVDSRKSYLSFRSVGVSIPFEESRQFTLGDGLLTQGTRMASDSRTILGARSNGPFIDSIQIVFDQLSFETLSRIESFIGLLSLRLDLIIDLLIEAFSFRKLKGSSGFVSEFQDSLGWFHTFIVVLDRVVCEAVPQLIETSGGRISLYVVTAFSSLVEQRLRLIVVPTSSIILRVLHGVHYLVDRLSILNFLLKFIKSIQLVRLAHRPLILVI